MQKRIHRAVSLLFAAIILMATATAVNAVEVSDFKDVRPESWYYKAVEYAVNKGLFSGTSETSFSPEAGMTRGMFVAVLGRKSGVSLESPTVSRFSDVKPTDYFASSVEWAAEYGIVSGISEKNFAPEKQISREQIAAILYRYAQRTGNDTSVDPRKFETFPDKARVSSYAVQAMKWAVSHGIINGSDGKLDPRGAATRAQVAQMLLGAKDVLLETDLAEPEPGESMELAAIRKYLNQNLPSECQWSESALDGGWIGALLINDGGWWHDVQYFGIEYVAKYCEYMLTEIDGITYGVYYIKETPEGFFLYYA